MTRYGRSPWLDEFPRSRVPSYASYRGASTVDVVVVGGGLTGCATAYALSASGIPTVLLEAQRVGRGSTAFSTGWIADDPGASFADIEKALGLRSARRAWQAWRRAALDFSALVRRLDLKCHLEARETATTAATAEQLARIKKEQKSRIAAGIETPLLTARHSKAETAVESLGAIRGRDGATLDPYRACVGLASAAVDRGAKIFEKTEVRRITFTRKHADVHTAAGKIRTRKVVIAIGFPTATLFKSLARHFWFHSRFVVQTEAVPARIRQHLGRASTVVRDSAAPPHVVLRVGDDRLLIAGADGEMVPPRQRERVVVQRTGQLMYELSTLYPDVSGIQPAYGWATDYARTADGLPYIGAHRNFPHHLFAFGDASAGVTGAFLASRVLLRQVSGEMDPADEVFGFHR